MQPAKGSTDDNDSNLNAPLLDASGWQLGNAGVVLGAQHLQLRS